MRLRSRRFTWARARKSATSGRPTRVSAADRSNKATRSSPASRLRSGRYTSALRSRREADATSTSSWAARTDSAAGHGCPARRRPRCWRDACISARCGSDGKPVRRKRGERRRTGPAKIAGSGPHRQTTRAARASTRRCRATTRRRGSASGSKSEHRQGSMHWRHTPRAHPIRARRAATRPPLPAAHHTGQLISKRAPGNRNGSTTATRPLCACSTSRVIASPNP
ncbi:patatin domain protein [Burkholderia pseudomallei MSHR2451]|nr:patatin domain protein [Burkholderia pseudomallei MSHR2451]